MGMSDRPKTFNPAYAPIRDDVIGKAFAPCAVRRCTEPHVVDRWGIGWVCNVSVYTCRKCKYKVKHKYHGGLSCGYGMEQRVQAGEDGKLG